MLENGSMCHLDGTRERETKIMPGCLFHRNPNSRISESDGLMGVFTDEWGLIFITGIFDILWMQRGRQRRLLGRVIDQMMNFSIGEEIGVVKHDHAAVATCDEHRYEQGWSGAMEGRTRSKTIGHFHTDGNLIITLMNARSAGSMRTDSNRVGHMHLITCKFRWLLRLQRTIDHLTHICDMIEIDLLPNQIIRIGRCMVHRWQSESRISLARVTIVFLLELEIYHQLDNQWRRKEDKFSSIEMWKRERDRERTWNTPVKSCDYPRREQTDICIEYWGNGLIE